MRTTSRRRLPLVVAALIVLAIGAVLWSSRPQSEPSRQTELSRSDQGDLIAAAERSLVDFWSRELPAVYQRDFRPLDGGFQPKTPDSPQFTCGGQPQSYDDLRGNAFYCSGGEDYIAWDATELIPQLTERFGPLAPAIVLAHEMGHAIQARAQVEGPSVLRELQADCFAGSWTRYAQTTADDGIDVTDRSLDSAVATILVLRDPPGTSASAEQAHGLGFDRVNAFESGYEQGAASCAALPDKGVVTTELPFRTQAEASTGGNLPLDQTISVVSERLDAFWTGVLPRIAAGRAFTAPTGRPAPGEQPPGCGDTTVDGGGVAVAAYCPATRTVSWSTPELVAVHQRIGDLGSGTLLSEAWASAGQSQAGLSQTGERAVLQRDCFTGAWLAFLAQGDLAGSPLSPGDLDEALTTIVSSSGNDTGAGAFERTKSLRTGLFGDYTSCTP